MHLPAIIAIDGPAASGKSTIGYLLAQRLDYLYFDTGVMYRAVTWAALNRSIPVGQQQQIGALAAAVTIDLLPPTAARTGSSTDGRQNTILLDQEDITWAIRQPEVDQNVSAVAANPGVRTALTAQQRRIGLGYANGQADKPGIVMVGRDIGTVVLPEAPCKIYLDAPVTERARRRYQELQERGEQIEYDLVLADMQRRDAIDSQRAVAPLRPATDAHIVNTTGLSVVEVLTRIREIVNRISGG